MLGGLLLLYVIYEWGRFAGGYSKFASENATMIVRKQEDKESEIRVRGKRLIREGDLKENHPLVAGDFVIIGESLF